MTTRNEDTAGAVLACVPGAIPPAERPAHFSLIRELFQGRVEERRALPDGAAFRFPPDAYDAVARFVANERRCCPFLRFSLEVPPDGAPLWLRITGPEGTADFLEAELSI